MVGKLWSINSNPAAGTVASASIVGTPGTQHYCTGITISWVVTTALAGGQTVYAYLRDGATGVGAILWVAALGLPGTAAIGTQTQIVPQGLLIIGTPGNAMTLEFSAGVASTEQTVSANGYDQV